MQRLTILQLNVIKYTLSHGLIAYLHKASLSKCHYHFGLQCYVSNPRSDVVHLYDQGVVPLETLTRKPRQRWYDHNAPYFVRWIFLLLPPHNAFVVLLLRPFDYSDEGHKDHRCKCSYVESTLKGKDGFPI